VTLLFQGLWLNAEVAMRALLFFTVAKAKKAPTTTMVLPIPD
jgi:hypothetical protein